MPVAMQPDEIQDDLVASVATVLSIANQCARERGVNVAESLISIAQQDENVSQWRVNYGPREFLNRRGGDLIVFVDAATKTVTQVLLGQ